MVGTFASIYVLAYNSNDHGQPVPAFDPRPAATEDAAIEEARDFVTRHASVAVWNAMNVLWAKKANPRFFSAPVGSEFA